MPSSPTGAATTPIATVAAIVAATVVILLVAAAVFVAVVAPSSSSSSSAEEGFSAEDGEATTLNELGKEVDCATMQRHLLRSAPRCGGLHLPRVRTEKVCVDGRCLDAQKLAMVENAPDMALAAFRREMQQVKERMNRMARERRRGFDALADDISDSRGALADLRDDVEEDREENQGRYVLARGGDRVIHRDGRRIHVFRSDGEIHVDAGGEVELLVVGGGGSGGGGGPKAYDPAGGGGGGEVVHLKRTFVPTGTSAVKVGQGGRKAGIHRFGAQGGVSSVFGVRANGGGGGARGRSDGRAGGSGGGTGRLGNTPGRSELLHPQGMGNEGGPSTNNGGGGGGATEAGRVLHGGEGYSTSVAGSGKEVVYGSGGGGGKRDWNVTGRGGTNAGDGGGEGKPGKDGTGGGGGGGQARGSGGRDPGGAGGSGIVVVSYELSPARSYESDSVKGFVEKWHEKALSEGLSDGKYWAKVKIGDLSIPRTAVTYRSSSTTISPDNYDASEWFTNAKDTEMAAVVINGDLDVKRGVDLTPPTRKLFVVVYVAGKLRLDGRISVDRTGPNHSGDDDSGFDSAFEEKNIPLALGDYGGETDPHVPAKGGKGGRGYRGFEVIPESDYSGHAGAWAHGSDATNGGTGGGGTGGSRGSWGTQKGGADGTAFVAGAGQQGNNGGATIPRPPPRGGESQQSVYRGGQGLPGTLVVFVGGGISGQGGITADGFLSGSRGDGRGRAFVNGACGGGSVTVFYGGGGSPPSSITVSADGGKGRRGADGGDGTARILPMSG